MASELLDPVTLIVAALIVAWIGIAVVILALCRIAAQADSGERTGIRLRRAKRLKAPAGPRRAGRSAAGS